MIPIKVLLADDEPLVRERYATRIPWEQAGFEFIGAACHGQEAIAMIERDPPHLALIDITMPVMDGMKLAETIRLRWPAIRIVFLTAHDEFEYVKKALLIGANDYLLKVALSAEQVLETCERVARSIRSAMEQSAQNELEQAQLAQYRWARRKEALDLYVASSSEEERTDSWRKLKEWLPDGEVQHTALVWIGWHLYGIEIGIHAGAAESTRLPSPSASERQRTMCEAWQHIVSGGAGNVAVEVFPYGLNRLAAVLSVRSGVSLEQLLETRLTDWLARLEAESGLACFAYTGKACRTEEGLAELLKRGMAGYTAHFYDKLSIHYGWGDRTRDRDINYARLTPEAAAELLRGVRLSLRGGGDGYIRDVFAQLTELGTPPADPADLLRVAEQIMSEEAFEAYGSEKMKLARVETWPQYVDWWMRVMDTALPAWSSANTKITRGEIREACRYIQEHYAEELLLSDIAYKIGMNPNYFGQLFKQETGEYFSEYLNRIRIRRAAVLLERSQHKIYEVAHAVGITDYRHFCKTFKKITGLTPTEYKSKPQI